MKQMSPKKEKQMLNGSDFVGYKCDLCQKIFDSHAKLAQHSLQHNGINAFQCQTCHKKFNTFDSYSSHLKIHLSSKNEGKDENNDNTKTDTQRKSKTKDSDGNSDTQLSNEYIDLMNKFGVSSFRGKQKIAIDSLINDKNVMLVMPTGNGKSLCYQIPMLVKIKKYRENNKEQSCVNIVISPLIALQNDQVSKLRRIFGNGRCVAFNGTLKPDEKIKLWRKIHDNEIDILFMAPEMLESQYKEFKSREIKILMLAVDEAHCLRAHSSFRSSFGKIGFIREYLDYPVTLACTATATTETQLLIKKKLYFDRKNERHECIDIVSNIDRPNISLSARKLPCINAMVRQEFEHLKHILRNSDNQIIYQQMKDNIQLSEFSLVYNVGHIIYQFLKNCHFQRKIIIYTGTRKWTTVWQEWLDICMKRSMTENEYSKYLKSRSFRDDNDNETDECKANIVNKYHGGMNMNQRNENQFKFQNGSQRVMTATTAFGMGIDIPNVGLIIHRRCPASIEDYWQEIGRAGRDGNNSKAILFYDETQKSSFGKWAANTSAPSVDETKNILNSLILHMKQSYPQRFKVGNNYINAYIINKRKIFSQWAEKGTNIVNRVLNIAENENIIETVQNKKCPFKIKFYSRNVGSYETNFTEYEKSILQQVMNRYGRWNEIKLTQILSCSKFQMTKDAAISMLDKAQRIGLLKHEYSSDMVGIKLLKQIDQIVDLIDWEKVQLEHAMNEKQWQIMHQYAILETSKCRRAYVLRHFGQRATELTEKSFACCDHCQ